MKRIESALVAGAGAVGLTVAGKLFDYNREGIAVLARGERLRRCRDRGFFINNRRCDFILADPDNPGDRERHFDLVIFASKFHHLKQIIDDTKPLVSPDTIFVSLLNGISSEEIIGGVFGRERIPLAMILGVDAQHSGGTINYTNPGIIHFGDREGRITGRDERIKDLFTRAGIPFVYHPADMKRALWYKFMFNVGINQVSALLRLPYGPLKKNSPSVIFEVRELMHNAMREAVAVANAEGIDLNEADMEAAEAAFAGLAGTGYTSMCQDVLAERKTEVELFGLTVMELGKKHGIKTPVNETLFQALRATERRYGAF